MTESRDVLFELGTEELPPKSLLTLSLALQSQVESGLKKAGLADAVIQPYATPRRLALVIQGLAVAQPDQEIERRGPAANAAFQPDGSPSKALAGFLRSCNATAEQLLTLETDKGAWVAIRQNVKGGQTADLLPDIFRQALAALPIAKRMRWGDGTAEFVRPVHWVVLLFGNEVIEAEILGIATGRITRGHRFHSTGPITLNAPDEYAGKLLNEGHVLADFETRKQKVRTLAEAAAAKVNGHAVIDADLLDEVTALVEWPVPVLGGIEARYLELPAEVLITTIQNNQKYFPVKDARGRLLPHFITFSNLDSTRLETVREGNERVVRPRLTDAEFFWNLDRKRTLESRVEELAQVTFQKTLGSLLDKTGRVRSLALAIADKLGQDGALADRAAMLAKADLLTSMVGEFPELQGTMGRYYALAEGEPVEIAEAIEEQYLPKVSGGPLPRTNTGLILALAEKLDTLTGIFSAGLIPTGDKDPYALRRAALGAIRIFIEADLDLNVPELLDAALAQFKHPFDAIKTRELVHTFMLERLRGYSLDRGYRPDEFEAVLAVWPASLVDFERRLQAVQEFRRLPEAESLAAANKRIRNILKKAGEDVVANVDDAALVEPAEKALLEAARKARESILPSLQQRDYTATLQRLAQLREPVDGFFDGVMVMVEDPDLRRNRLGLLGIIEGLFLDIADISKLQN
ncbi:MAG: glycine--tRNA ligase subunit beta [Methylococcaceae bacterium]|nr:glycine--tRNA ligase subunit beta [Methylococcaceae bacterium]